MVGAGNVELAGAEGAGLACPAVFLLNQEGVRGSGAVEEFAGEALEVRSTRGSGGEVGLEG